MVGGWRIKAPSPGSPAVFPLSARAQNGGRPALHRLVSIPESRAFVRQKRHSLVNVVFCKTERFPYHVGVRETHAEERGDVLLLFGLHFWGVSVSQANRNSVVGAALWLCTPPCLQSSAAGLSRSSFHSTAPTQVLCSALASKNYMLIGSAHCIASQTKVCTQLDVIYEGNTSITKLLWKSLKGKIESSIKTSNLPSR